MRNRRNIEQKSKPRAGWLFKIIALLVLFGISGLLFVNSARSIMTAYNRNLLLEQAEDEVNSLRIENLELIEQKEQMVDDSYVESEARDRVSYSKKGEKVVVLPETGQDVVLGEETEKDDSNEEKIEGWERWWNLLKNGV